MNEELHARRSDDRAMVSIAQSRQAQEVQAAMVVARRFPRDTSRAYAAIMESCKRKSLAEQAKYAYPRGGTIVEGPSIRLAEVLAQAWGNLSFGIIEVEQRPGESTVMAYAWDLETNVRQDKVFTVAHIRGKKTGNVKLTDPRDIYEMTANQGARRLRACILGVIPGDIVEAALERCTKTLTEGHSEPLSDRVRKMASVFREIGVSIPMLEARLGHRLDATTEHELVTLRGIYLSIKDNMAAVDQFFERPRGVGGPGARPAAAQPKRATRSTEETGERVGRPTTSGTAEGDPPHPPPPAAEDPEEPEPPRDGQKGPGERGRKRPPRRSPAKANGQGRREEPPETTESDAPAEEAARALNRELEKGEGAEPGASAEAEDSGGGAEPPTEDPDEAPRPIAGAQLARIHIAWKRLPWSTGMDPDAIRRLYLKAVYGKESSAKLTTHEARDFLEVLESAAQEGDGVDYFVQVAQQAEDA